jgi:tetratricopeptide (TPR) repeat protein
LATCKSALGKDEEAFSLLNQAIDLISEGLDILSNIALVLLQSGKLKETIQVCKMGLLAEKKLNVKSIDQITFLHFWGTSLRYLGKSKEAIPLHRRAIELGEEYLGSEHPFLANPICALGFELGDVGKGKSASLMFKRALTILENADPEDSKVLGITEHLGNTLFSP